MNTFKERARLFCYILPGLIILNMSLFPVFNFGGHMEEGDMHNGYPFDWVEPELHPEVPGEPDPPFCHLPPEEICEVNTSVSPGSEDEKICVGGEPINLFDGSFYYRQTDLEIKGRIPILIRRAYDTRSLANSVFGYGWSFNYHMRIIKMSDGALLLKRGDNSKDRYTYNSGSGVYTGPAGIYDTITLHADDTYTLNTKHAFQYHFDINGALSKMEDENGNQLLFSYDPAGKLPVSGVSPYSNIENPIIIGYDYRLISIDEAKNDTMTGRYIELAYNDDGRISTLEDFTGRTVFYGYDSGGHGELLSVTDPEGNIYEFTYTDHLMTSFVAPNEGCAGGCSGGGLHTNVYDTEKRVVRQMHGNNMVEINYVIPEEQTKVTTKIYTAEAPGFLINTREEIYTFNEKGLTTQYVRKAESGDLITSFSYDPVTGHLIQRTDHDWGLTAYTYDTMGNVLTETAELSGGENLTRTYTYDYDFNRIASLEISSSTEIQAYRTEYTYYPDGRLWEEIKILDSDPDLVTTYEYTPEGDIEIITDPRGNRMKSEYMNDYGFVNKIYDPDNSLRKTLYNYDEIGNIIFISDANEHNTQLRYDGLNRLKRMVNAKGEKTIYTWEGPNLVQIENGRVGSQNGQITRIEYDELNRRAKISRMIGSTEIPQVSYTYDSEGKILKTTDVFGHGATKSYDELGRLVSSKDALGHETKYEYDRGNNLSKMTDANGIITAYGHDYLNRLIQVVQNDGLNEILTDYTYNALGQILTVKDAENHTTMHTYDGAGRLLQIKDPLEYMTGYEYGEKGNLVQQTDPKGQITEYKYDAYNQLTAVYYGGESSPVKTVTFSYDNVGNMETWDDGSYSANYVHDELNRAISVSTTYYVVTKTVSYTYDRFGNRTAVEYPDSLGTVTYAYDQFNRVGKITDYDSRSTTYSYDYTGKLMKKVLPNGVFTEYEYNAANQLTSLVNYKLEPITTFISNDDAMLSDIESERTFEGHNTGKGLDREFKATPISSFEYQLDNVGNRVSMTTLEGTHFYQYDDLYRLTAADYPDERYQSHSNGNNQKGEPLGINSDLPSDNLFPDNQNKKNNSHYMDVEENNAAPQRTLQDESYTYDKVGNRLSSADYSGWLYDENNRLLSYNGIDFTYDDNGNLIQNDDNGSITTYTYDYENRLIEVQTPEHLVQFEYDPFGKRLKKAVDGGAIFYVYDKEDIILEYNGPTTLYAEYVHGTGIDEPISMTSSETTYCYTMDGLGSVVDLTDDNETMAEQYSYDSFGNLETPPTTENPYIYTSREYDSESGFYFYRARYYGPSTGRFITEDPILKPRFDFIADRLIYGWQFPTLLNSPTDLLPYIYVKNNAINFSDPMGLLGGCGLEGRGGEGGWRDYPAGISWTKFCRQHDCCCACGGRSCNTNFCWDLGKSCISWIGIPVAYSHCINTANLYCVLASTGCRPNHKDCCKCKEKGWWK